MKKRRTKKKKKSAAQFSFAERVKIETYLDEGISKQEIARRLKREPSSVRYEIKMNSVRGVYTAEKAQLKAYQRRWRAKTQVLKVAVNKMLKDYVTSAVKQYWSPEAIVGRIRFVDRHVPRVGKDAIYAFLESVHGRKLEEYLKIGPEKIVFVGDALFQGGNDYPAKATGVDCIQVSGPEETKELIRAWLR